MEPGDLPASPPEETLSPPAKRKRRPPSSPSSRELMPAPKRRRPRAAVADVEEPAQSSPAKRKRRPPSSPSSREPMPAPKRRRPRAAVADVEEPAQSSPGPRRSRRLRTRETELQEELADGSPEEEEEEEEPLPKVSGKNDAGVQAYLKAIGNPFRTLFLTIRELVENSLDATELATRPTIDIIIAEIKSTELKRHGVKKPKKMKEEHPKKCYHITCKDNGSGLARDDACKMLGTLFCSSKEVRQQARGKFGIGAKMVFTQSFESTKHAISIKTVQEGRNDPLQYTIRKESSELDVSFEPMNNENSWVGTEIELYTLGIWKSEETVIKRYLELIPLVNQNIRIDFEFKPVRGKSFKGEYGTHIREPLEHNNQMLGRFDPSNISEATLRKGIECSQQKTLKEFLVNDFMKINDGDATKIIKRMKSGKKTTLTDLRNADGPSRLHDILKKYKYEGDVNNEGLFPIGEHFASSIKKYINNDETRISKVSQSTSSFDGYAFMVEAVIAIGKKQKKKEMKVYRFANKAPLVLGDDSDIVTFATKDIKWSDFNISLSKSSIHIFVSIVGPNIPFNGIQKESMTDDNKIKTAIKEALTACCEDLSVKPVNDPCKFINRAAYILSKAAENLGKPEYTKTFLEDALEKCLREKVAQEEEGDSQAGMEREDHSQDNLEIMGNVTQNVDDDSAIHSPPQHTEVSQDLSSVDLDDSAINVTPQADEEVGQVQSPETLTFTDQVFNQKTVTFIQFWDKEECDGEEYWLSGFNGEDLERSFSKGAQVERLPIDYLSQMLSYDDGKHRTGFDPGHRIFLHTQLTQMITHGEAGETEYPNRLTKVLSFLKESIEKIRKAKLIFLPFLYERHWSVYCLDMGEKKTIILDSQYQDFDPHHKFRKEALSFLHGRLEKIWKEVPDFTEWTPVFHPIQMHGLSDKNHGIIMMKHMEYFHGSGFKEDIDAKKVDEYREGYLKRMLVHECNLLRDMVGSRFKMSERDLPSITTTQASEEIADLSQVPSLDVPNKMTFRRNIFEKKDLRFIQVACPSPDNPEVYSKVGLKGDTLATSFTDHVQVERDVIDIFARMLSQEEPPKNFPTGRRAFLPSSITELAMCQEYDEDPTLAMNMFKLLKASQKEICQAKLIFLPFYHSTHWTLTCLDLNKKEIDILDSLNGGDKYHTFENNALVRIWKQLRKIWNGVPQFTTWKINYPQTRQQQCNDCGILMMKYMEYWNGNILLEDIRPDKANEYRADYLFRMIYHKCNNLTPSVRSWLTKMVQEIVNASAAPTHGPPSS